jgi:LCP family protein required for cell wall assembly
MKSAGYVPETLQVPWNRPDSSDKKVQQKRHFSVKRLLKRAIITMLVVVLAVGGFLGYKVYENAAKLDGTHNPFKLLSTFTPSMLSTTDGRVNILLAGYSADDPGHQGADLTDSIMILSIDTSTKKAVLISVPRDLYVNIPGYGYSKINAAYEDGHAEGYNATGYSSSGMALLGATLTQDFGIHFNYDALIDYTAFRDAVNALGGVTVTINSSDARGLYDPNTNLKVPNGTVTLNGAEALDLARARGDGVGSYGFPDGDFDRTEHQQQLLVALKNKASSTSVIANPLKIASLVDAVGNNIQTNLKIGDMETLYYDTKGISDTNIQDVTLNDYNNQDLLTDYTTYDGEDALVPAAGLGDYSHKLL